MSDVRKGSIASIGMKQASVRVFGFVVQPRSIQTLSDNGNATSTDYGRILLSSQQYGRYRSQKHLSAHMSAKTD